MSCDQRSKGACAASSVLASTKCSVAIELHAGLHVGGIENTRAHERWADPPRWHRPPYTVLMRGFGTLQCLHRCRRWPAASLVLLMAMACAALWLPHVIGGSSSLVWNLLHM